MDKQEKASPKPTTPIYPSKPPIAPRCNAPDLNPWNVEDYPRELRLPAYATTSDEATGRFGLAIREKISDS